MRRFISAAVLRDIAKSNKKVVLEEDCVLTPSAKDLAKELGITICKGREEIGRQNLAAGSSTEVGIQSEDLKKAVRKLLDEVLKPACENPKATHVKGETVVVQPFLEAPPGQTIGLVDVIDSRVGNLASGFMTFDHAQLPWFLNYDEVDYVIEGEFVLKVSGQVFRAKQGDVVYIPKGSQVVFSSPSFCKVFYCTYPANWADFCN